MHEIKIFFLLFFFKFCNISEKIWYFNTGFVFLQCKKYKPILSKKGRKNREKKSQNFLKRFLKFFGFFFNLIYNKILYIIIIK